MSGGKVPATDSFPSVETLPVPPPDPPNPTAKDTEDDWIVTKIIDNEGYPETNMVSTKKYSAWDFFPRTFALQYRRIGNIYFSVIVLIMLLGTYTNLFQSPQKPWGNLFILIIIFGLNMTNEFIDDKARERNDKETNSQLAKIYDPSEHRFVEKTWGDVRRGDLIRLDKNLTCPADILLISTSDTDTEPCCYIQTAAVDGETYLKKRMCKQEVLDSFVGLETCVSWLQGRTVKYEGPTPSLSAFKIILEKEKGTYDGGCISFSSENTLLRGAELRNTEWIWGVVLFTGRDTKALMAQGSTRIKQSKVDQMANKVIITVLLMLFLLLLISLLVLEFGYESTTKLWYMMYTPEAEGYIFPSGLALLFTYLILYRQILPILLYAVQEGMNVIQAKYIGWDLGMYDESTGKFASCNTTQLAQEIGQIKWIFSDKTGTLTRNEMRLVSCAIDGRIYGRVGNKSLERLANVKLPPLKLTRYCFSDMLSKLVSSNDDEDVHHGDRIRNLLKAMALCHTVLVEVEATPTEPLRKDSTRRLRRSSLSSRHLTKVLEEEAIQLQDTEENDEEEDDDFCPSYNAESPDEEALVSGATALGYQFAFTRGEALVGLKLKVPVPRDLGFDDVQLYDLEDPSAPTTANKPGQLMKQPSWCSNIPGTTELWEVLAINPFTSDRKRMSVIYRDPNQQDRIVLICKGADNQMLAAANPDTTDFAGLKRDLLTFSESGLRTLIVAEKELDKDVFEKWAEKHAMTCKLPPKQRKACMDEVASEIEVDMNVLGITAVEDRLQDGVPQTISLLRAARINIWLITGDKVETAINISRSAELLTNTSRLLHITASSLGLKSEEDDDNEEGAETEEEIQGRIMTLLLEYIVEQEKLNEPQSSVQELENSKGLCTRLIDICKKKLTSTPVVVNPDLALIVDGEALHYIINKVKNAALEDAFLNLARMCNVVVACRASPGQKAQLVKMVKDNVHPTPTTLAIGDGANDVPMLEAGHVGVGIAGKEGTHAVNSSDFAIGQFKFLAPLLLVHGRFGYIRVAKAISITFYGNLLFTFLSFFYNFVCAFSGLPAFTAIQYVIFQAFIAIPVFAIGFFDRDYKHVYDALKDPRSYDVGRLNRILHPAFVDAQILRGLVHGVIAFFLVFWNDWDATYRALSGALFIVTTFILTVRQGSVASCYTWFLFSALLFNVVCVILLIFITNILSGPGTSIFDLKEWGRYYWNQMIATVLLVCVLDYLAPIAYRQFRMYSKVVKEKLPNVEMDDSFMGFKSLFSRKSSNEDEENEGATGPENKGNGSANEEKVSDLEPGIQMNEIPHADIKTDSS